MNSEANITGSLYIHDVLAWRIRDVDPEAPSEIRDDNCLHVLVKKGRKCPASLDIPDEYEGLRVFLIEDPFLLKGCGSIYADDD